MTIAAADIQALFSEFAATDTTKIGLYLNFASDQISETYFGNLYDQAHAYLAAHMLKLDAMSTVGSASVTSKKVGDIQTNYANPLSAAVLGETSYGVMFKAISSKAKGKGPSVLT